MGSLDGQVAIVTGAGRGIGRAEARALASAGACVVVNDIDESAAAVAEEIRRQGGRAVADASDVASWSGAESLVEHALVAFGQLDVLVNNAGILRDRSVCNMSEAEWDDVMRVNLKGHFAPIHHACRHWRAQSKASGQPAGARIICTTSTSGLFGARGQANYGASKAGVASVCQIVSVEMRAYGVSCNAIAPGARTQMTADMFGSSQEDDPWAPEHVADFVCALVGRAGEGITGHVFYVAGGTVGLMDGWEHRSSFERDRAWSDDELAAHLTALFAGVSPSLEPRQSLLRRHLTTAR